MLFVDRAILGEAELFGWVDGHYQAKVGYGTEEFGRFPVLVSSEWLKRMGADIVISTVGGTREPMRSLAESVGALYIDHIGNAWDQPIGPNILWAVTNGGTSGVTYHPEFHRVPWVPPTGNRIGSFHASFAHSPCRKWWDEASEAHPEYEWRIFGTIEDQLRPHQVAQARSDCIAIWHCKDADGYGFGVHEAFASGRAVIGHKSHYEGKIAEPLFGQGWSHLEPGDTLDPMHFDAIGRFARAEFDSLVDFDAEADMVRDYLEARL
jgi:hypothetical protein